MGEGLQSLAGSAGFPQFGEVPPRPLSCWSEHCLAAFMDRNVWECPAPPGAAVGVCTSKVLGDKQKVLPKKGFT